MDIVEGEKSWRGVLIGIDSIVILWRKCGFFITRIRERLIRDFFMSLIFSFNLLCLSPGKVVFLGRGVLETFTEGLPLPDHICPGGQHMYLICIYWVGRVVLEDFSKGFPPFRP